MTTGAEALSEIYLRYQRVLHWRCQSLVGDPETARDLVQESFTRFLAGEASWRGEAAPVTVLFRIATNAAIDHLRRQRALPLPDDEDAWPAHTPPCADTALDLEILTRGLGSEAMAVARLRHVDGYTQEEIAGALEVSRRTVGETLRRFEEHVRKRGARMGYV